MFSELEKLVSSSDCDVVSVSRRGVEDDTTVTVTTGKVELVQVSSSLSLHKLKRSSQANVNAKFSFKCIGRGK